MLASHYLGLSSASSFLYCISLTLNPFLSSFPHHVHHEPHYGSLICVRRHHMQYSLLITSGDPPAHICSIFPPRQLPLSLPLQYIVLLPPSCLWSCGLQAAYRHVPVSPQSGFASHFLDLFFTFPGSFIRVRLHCMQYIPVFHLQKGS